MGKKIRPGSEGDALGQQAANLRQRAPGKRFVGERAGQSRQARRAELDRVVRMAEEDAAARRRAKLDRESIPGILVELVGESFRLTWTFARAPFRILAALRQVWVEGRA